jgi:hypothetical protein
MKEQLTEKTNPPTHINKTQEQISTPSVLKFTVLYEPVFPFLIYKPITFELLSLILYIPDENICYTHL